MQLQRLRLKNLNPRQQKLWNTFLFLLRLLILSIPLYIMLSLPGLLLPLQSMVTHNSVSLLSLNYPVSNENVLIRINTPGNEFQFLVSEDCTGWKSMLFLFALMFATLAVPLKKRLLGLLIGIPIIYLGNLSRILLIVLIQQAWGTPAAQLFHTWFWSLGLISLVLLVWVAWLWRTGKIQLNFKHNPNPK